MGNGIPERVLVVDDIKDNREILKRALSKRGCEVFEASGGAEALERIEQQRVDIVLLDIEMPDLNGFEVLRRMRMKYSPEELPIIMVTADSDDDSIVKALNLGANDYLTKPIIQSVAMARINSHLSRSEVTSRLGEKVRELQTVNQQLELETLTRKRVEEKAQYLSYHDQLTGLGNWSFLEDRMHRTLRQGRINNHNTLSMIVDVDDFSGINEVHGHDRADAVLVELADQLRQIVGKDGALARIGSNRFFAVIPGFETPADAIVRGESTSLFLANRAPASEYDPDYSVSIGMTISPRDGNRTDEVVENTNAALSRARSSNHDPFCFFDPDVDAELSHRRALRADLQLALKRQEFELYYQPIAGVDGATITGREALIRWNHPEHGLVSPAAFVPLAEENGMILQIGEWALREATRTARKLYPNDKIAVNISPEQFADPNFVRMVMSAIAESGIRAHQLELELTESILISDLELVTQKLHQLKALNVRVCLDDFGTGYSSLSYLGKFPVDKIKIDQSFVRSMFCEHSTRPILTAIINLAKQMDLEITAEGIETKEQMQWLKKSDCTEFQGFYIARPCPAGMDLQDNSKTGDSGEAVA